MAVLCSPSFEYIWSMLGVGIVEEWFKHLLQIDPKHETKSIFLYLYPCDWLKGDSKPLGCDEIRWVQPEDLAHYKLPPPDLRIIEFSINQDSEEQLLC